MFQVFCCPSTTTKHTSIGVKRRDAVAHRGAGVFQAQLGLLYANLINLINSDLNLRCGRKRNRRRAPAPAVIFYGRRIARQARRLCVCVCVCVCHRRET